MNRCTTLSLPCLIVALTLVFSCGPQASDPGTDGVTHFLKACVHNDDCGDELSCECGLCSRGCSTTTECMELGSNARCQPGASMCTSLPSPAAGGVCTLRCDTDSDCAESGVSLVCSEQRCVRSTSLELASRTPAAVSCDQGQACESLDCSYGSSRRRLDENCCSCEFVPQCESGDAVLIGPTDVANRLSMTLFTETADAELTALAAAARLDTSGQVGCFAREMLGDARAEAGISAFLETWLGVQSRPVFGDELVTDELFMDFATPELEQSLRDATTAFGQRAILQGEGLIDNLLLDRGAFVNQHNAELYGLNDVTGSEMQWVQLQNTRRAGLFTRGFFLASYGNIRGTSAVHRGIGARKLLLCGELPPPPPSVDTSLPDLTEPDATSRELLEQHTVDSACAGCHRLIDNLGYGFEHFDGLGRFREQEGGQAINAEAEVLSGDDADGSYAGPAELMQGLSQSNRVQACLSEHWLRYLLQIEPQENPTELAAWAEQLAARATTEQGFSLREMIVGSTESARFLTSDP